MLTQEIEYKQWLRKIDIGHLACKWLQKMFTCDIRYKAVCIKIDDINTTNLHCVTDNYFPFINWRTHATFIRKNNTNQRRCKKCTQNKLQKGVKLQDKVDTKSPTT